jgi:drug/metabolite transporter (DMT)-like permease
MSKPTGFWNPWVQLALSQLCTLASDLCLKRGASAVAHFASGWSWTGITALVSPLVWLGIVLMLLSFITWLYVLRHMSLSIAFPASQIVHIMVPLGSWLVLGEKISALRWIGIVLVVLGLFFVAKPVAKMEERL